MSEIWIEGGPSGMELALRCFGYRGFPQEGQCEVLFPDGTWKSAVLVNRWAEAEIPSGKRSYSFDVAGFDEGGNFHGRFDDQHIRFSGAGSELSLMPVSGVIQ